MADSAPPSLSRAAPISADARALGALDSLAAAEEVVRRLGAISGVSSWLFLRAYEDEWVVLAAHAPDYDFRPGDAVAPSHPAIGLDAATSAGRPADERSPAAHTDVVVDLSGVETTLAVGGDGGEGGFGSVIRVELSGPDGRTIARLAGLDPDPHIEPATFDRLRPVLELTAGLLASLLTVDLDRSRMQRRVDAAESAALSDALTALGNRRAFERAVEREDARCERFGHQAGVLILDLDGLKDVNDRDGHAAGDRLIQSAARALRSSVRSADQAFRIGGDEFAVVLPEITSGQLAHVADRVRDELRDAGVAASIGAAIRGRDDQLLDAVGRADDAMYEAKRRRAAVEE